MGSSPVPKTLPLAITGGRVPTASATVYEPRGTVLIGRTDQLAVEEPLEIRLASASGTSTISITMRTPGHDFELVAGFLLSEAVVDGRAQIRKIAYCLDEGLDPEQRFNVVTAEISGEPGRASIERLVMTSASCGVCGSASIDAVQLAGYPKLGPGPLIPFERLSEFPDRLRSGQRAFSATGGLHGIALISPDGDVVCLREDVGRHNAVDKVLGWAMLQGKLPLSEMTLMVSGRISFEIVQKALRAGVPIVAAVSAATSLAVRLAEETGMTLVGFLRGSSCAVYAGRSRISA
jgi:FdhD protein